MRVLVRRFFSDEAGATAIEYSVVAAGVALVLIAAVQNIGTHLKTTFSTVATAL